MVLLTVEPSTTTCNDSLDNTPTSLGIPCFQVRFVVIYTNRSEPFLHRFHIAGGSYLPHHDSYSLSFFGLASTAIDISEMLCYDYAHLQGMNSVYTNHFYLDYLFTYGWLRLYIYAISVI